MREMAMFLSIDDSMPLGIYWADDRGDGVVNLNKFLNESKIDMSKKLAGEYALRLQQFVDELKVYSDR